jgi:hypothetical protein
MVEDDTPQEVIRDASGRVAVPASAAARSAGVTNATMRRWLADGVVEGYVVQRDSRRRHYVFVESLDRLRGIGENDDTNDRDRWRARAAQFESTAALQKEIIDELLAAEAAPSADEKLAHLRRVAALQQAVFSQLAPPDEELLR